MNKKGISMISLVIIIIVTIILIAITVGAGYRYIEEANQLKADTLSQIIGNNAHKRQNDLNSGTTNRFYEGYYLDENKLISHQNEINGLPTEDSSGDGVYDIFQRADSMWYVIDAEAAAELGSDEAEGLLTRNISQSLNNGSEDTIVKVVIVDYMYGNAYYVAVPANILKDSLKYDSMATCPLSPDGKHRFTVATCTEDSECIYGCGTNAGPRALGHKWVVATCTKGGFCERCNAVNPDDSVPLGHLFITNAQITDANLISKMEERNCIIYEDMDSDEAWITNVEKHWHECLRCGIKKDETSHMLGFVPETDSLEATHHHQVCSVCGWQSIKSRHVFEITSTGDHGHNVRCKLCGYHTNHRDSGWQSDHPEVHYRYCLDDEDCNTQTVTINGTTIKVLFTEPHRDEIINATGAEGHDYACDVCGRALDTTPPLNFNVEDGTDITYARVKKVDDVYQITTSQITIEAFTIDRETGVDTYKFGIEKNGTITWPTDAVYTASSGLYVAEHTFKNLDSNTEYTFYVQAFDKNGNANAPAKVIATTAGFPSFNGVKNVPETFVKAGDPEAIIGVNDVDTSIPNISIVYRHNNDPRVVDPSWSSPVAIENINTIQITLSEEVENLEFKFVDDHDNESEISKVQLKVIDNTPPVVTISRKEGDDPSVEAMIHQAVIKLADAKSGIAAHTEVTYGWNTSKDIEPVTTTTYTTTNIDTVQDISFNVATPEGVKGTYYLWVYEGVKDAVGNATTAPVTSEFQFVIDDLRPEISNIRMFNANPAVPGEDLFVKTDGTVTVTFTASKALKQNPTVRLDDVNATSITHNGLDYTCTFPISTSYEEGILNLFIGDIIALNNRPSVRSYNNDDLTYGPVRYDRTLPEIEYIPKYQ